MALAVNGVPIDVLAERLGTTRGALCKTLHDARAKLRAHLAASGAGPGGSGGPDEAPRGRRAGTAAAARAGPAGLPVATRRCFACLDRHVGLEVAGADADAAIPGMREHLLGCPACREEHASLQALAGARVPSRRGAVRTRAVATLMRYGQRATSARGRREPT